MKKRIFATLLVFIIVLTTCYPAYAMETHENNIPESTILEDDFSKEAENEEELPMTEEEPVEITETQTDSLAEVETEEEDPEEEDPEEEDPEEEDPEEEDPEEEFPKDIYKVITSAEEVYVLELGERVETLALPETAFAIYYLFLGVDCEVFWRYDEFDGQTAGRHNLIGDVVLPEGYLFKDNIPITLSIPIIVYEHDGVPTEKIVSCHLRATIIPLGTPAEELPDYFDFSSSDKVMVRTENGDHFFLPYTLILDVIDTNVKGAYHPYIIDLPSYLIFDDKIEDLTSTVYVVSTDEIELDALNLVGGLYCIDVHWIYNAENLVLWAKVDDGNWYISETDVSTGFGGFLSDPIANKNGLYLELSKFEAGHKYSFQVQYDSDRFSNILILDFVNGLLPYSYFAPGGDRNGGDRGENEKPPELGGENTNKPNGNTQSTTDSKSWEIWPSYPPKLQAVVQQSITLDATAQNINNVPIKKQNIKAETPFKPQDDNIKTSNILEITSEPPVMPEEKEPVMPDIILSPIAEPLININIPLEFAAGNIVETIKTAQNMQVNDTTAVQNAITISGEELKMMMSVNPEYVSFLSREMRVSLPTEFLKGLDIASTDRFVAIVYQEDKENLVVNFILNDNPIVFQYLDPFILSLPWDSDPIICIDMNGTETESEYDRVSGKVEFHLNSFGKYKLEQKPRVAAAAVNQPPILDANIDKPVLNISENTPTNETSYKDTFVPVVVVCSISAFVVASFFALARIKRVNKS